MTLPKVLTFKVKRWTTGAWVQPLPSIRQRWGDDVGALAEMWASVVAEENDRPTSASKQYSLQRIVDDPGSIERDAAGLVLDTEIEPLLTAESWRLYRSSRLESLAHDQLRECARQALQNLLTRRGRPQKHAGASVWVADLLRIAEGRMRKRQFESMLEDILMATRAASPDPHTIRRLVDQARRQRGAPRLR